MGRLIITLALIFHSTASLALEIGVLAPHGAEKATAQWRAFMDYLSVELGQPVEMVPVEAVQGVDQFNEYRFDFLLGNPVQTAVVVDSMAAIPVASLRRPRGDAFGGVIVTKKESDIKTVDDLRRARIGGLGQWAAGGFVFQTALLSNMGFDPRTEAASFEIASDQTVLIEDLLANKYDAVFVRTGVVESFVETGYLDPDAIAIFNEQQDDVFPYVRSTILYPEWFLVSQATTDPQLITAVQSAAFALPPDAAAAVDAQILGFGPPLDVTGVIEAMRAAAVPPYD